MSGAASGTPPEARLLHLGDRFAALAKPAGISLATPRVDPHAAARRLVAALPPEEREMLAGRDVRLAHRLDVSTSGVVIVALDEECHRDLLALFAARAVLKLYLALVWGHPRPRRARLEAPLGPDPRDRRRMRVAAGGRPARTDYRVAAVAPHAALLIAEPRTGRTHQIRVHLAAAGHPVIGDDLYGGPRHRGVRDETLAASLAGARSMLHAWRLELPGLEPVRFEAPPPADFRSLAAALGLDLVSGGDLWQSVEKSDGSPPLPLASLRVPLRSQ